jgi:molecular chaperone DnaK (HSP70)
MSEPKYIVGIDLGTTNTVLAYTEAQAPEHGAPEIRVFAVPQLVAPGELQPQPLLPSFLYLPGPHDAPEGSLALPWQAEPESVAGEFARRRGAEIPNRLVASAKSWLSHGGIDRSADILPWDSPPDVTRISPVQASARFLRHLREAWDHVMAAEDPAARLEAQDVYLTVPASFDALARELTVQAAHAAGLEGLTLLEEPQAAFYAWIEANGEAWRKAVKLGEQILVCDVGGGTTDLSLIQVTEEEGDLALRRVAVGEHILLGGDNMDLTLAYTLQGKLAAAGTKLDAWQFRGLWHSCRLAKEKLLAGQSETEPVVILGRGSSLIKGTIRTELTRDELEKVLLDGFFPPGDITDQPHEKPRVGIREIGLPYASDPAVTRHLARFLGRQAKKSKKGSELEGLAAVLFNGGVMKPERLRARVLEILGGWRKEKEPLRELQSVDLDLAVARGAAYYGLARRGRGIRIRGGTARSYYVGVESAMPAVPGIPTPIKALCVVPFGMEEGTERDIRQREFGLVVGYPAVFHLMASTVRKKDAPGEIVEDWQGDIDEVSAMEASLTQAEADEPTGAAIPVWLQSRVTEVGTLELWCVARDQESHRWKLEFQLLEREGE